MASGRWIAAAAITAIMLVVLMPSALTQVNSVPNSKASQISQATGPNVLKPTFCDPITLTAKASGSGTVNGTVGADLVTASSGNDSVNGLAGSDCILAGGGDDTIDAGDGDDYIIGGPGSDTCLGGLGTDVFDATCEFPVQ